jgi:hypothetical protein
MDTIRAFVPQIRHTGRSSLSHMSSLLFLPPCVMRPVAFLVLVVFCAGLPIVAHAKLPPPPRRHKLRYAVRQSNYSRAATSAVVMASASGATIPMWSYTVSASRDGNSYTGVMVGRSPFFHGHRTTTIPTYLVPVILNMPDGGVFDPTVPDSCIGNSTVVNAVVNSPIFQNNNFIMNGADVGSTLYHDAFQRANFWDNVSLTGDSYHTRLNVTTLPAVTINVPFLSGATNLGLCGLYGDLDINWWDNYVQTVLIPSLAAQGVGPSSFPLFLFDSVDLCDTNSCGIGGYHYAYSSPVQTYGVSDFDTSGEFPAAPDVAILTHEVGEWMNDPVITNPTPPWGNVGQVIGQCQNNLEVGDPLSGTNVPPVSLNGFTYHLQELAFFSWFYGQPSSGAGGLYSNNGTFSTDAGPVCH